MACYAGVARSKIFPIILMISMRAAELSFTMLIYETRWRYKIVSSPRGLTTCFTSPRRATRKPPSRRRSTPWTPTSRELSAFLAPLRRFSPEAIIHVCASSEVFGRVPREKLPIDEECTFHPASPYAISKVGTDLVGRYYAEAYKMCVMTTRMFTHTGPRRGDVFAESTFAKQIAMIEGNKLPPVVKVGNLEFAAHLGRRPRRRARLSYAGHHQSDARRLLQYRRAIYLHGARHAGYADRQVDLRQHPGRSRS